MSIPAGAISNPEAVIQAYIQLASINHRVNFNAVASLTWLVYDIITCFDQEVELVWKTRWTVPKVLYVSLRYYAPLWLMYQNIIHLVLTLMYNVPVTHGNKLSALSCTSFPPLQAIGPVVLWILVDILMILGIRALYRAQKSVGVTVIFIWLVAACVVIPVTVYCFRLSRPVPAPPPFDAIAGCVVPSINFKKIGMIKIAVIGFMIVNMMYLGLTLYKFVESIRELRSLQIGSMFSIFVGEGVAYFVGCIAINAADLVESCGGPSTFPYVDLLQFWLGAFYSYAGCHLILHLRSASSSLTSLTSFADCADLEVRYPAKGKDSESPLNDDTCTMISLSARYGDALHNSTMGAESDIVQASRTSENDESSSQHISTAV